MSEREKMLRGELYDAYDEELCELREKCRQAVREFNSLSASDMEGRRKLLGGLLASAGKNAFFLNVSFDYGVNTRIGDEFSANFNFTVLDCAEVSIGNNVLIGANVTLATPMHSLLAEERNFQMGADGRRHLYEYAKPIVIEDNVWIASGVTVCAGVTIGQNSVIGAGSVVTRDVPPNSLAYGVPCRAIREICSDHDRILQTAAQHPEL